MSVCWGAERIEGYVSQQTIMGLVAVGTIVGIPAGFFMACLTKSTPALVIILLALMPGPLMILKFKPKIKSVGLVRLHVNGFADTRENKTTNCSE